MGAVFSKLVQVTPAEPAVDPRALELMLLGFVIAVLLFLAVIIVVKLLKTPYR
jgi:hypothetical protein